VQSALGGENAEETSEQILGHDVGEHPNFE